jgi:hypothetical protein
VDINNNKKKALAVLGKNYVASRDGSSNWG